MKIILPLFLTYFFIFTTNAQSVVKGISPATIANCYEHTVATGWGNLPILSNPGVSFQDTLIMGNDGTPGTNLQGNPIAEEGCSSFTNNVTGKIAVVFRNTCSFVQKAINAQNAGAIGLIVINRENTVIAMGGSDPTVTIPVVMISLSDGLALKASILNGPTVMYLGHDGFTGNLISNSQNSCFANPTGFAVANSTYGPGPYTYLWNNSATTDSIFGLGAGTYTVIATNASNCSIKDSVVISNLPQFQPTIVTSSPNIICSSGSIDLSTTQTYPSYVWSNGDVGPIITTSTCGWYLLTVTDNAGCQSSMDSIYIGCSYLSPPEICIVTTNATNPTNDVIWEKPTTIGIDSFYVYRQTSSNNYIKIGALDFADTAIFIDNQINPNSQAYTYKITSVDTCGGESDYSSPHKTIHLSATFNPSLNWYLSWTPYIGTSITSYDIYRGASPQNMTLITSLPPNILNYTDINPPLTGNVYYQVKVEITNVCNPLLKSTDLGTINSNIPNNGFLSIDDKIENGNNLLIYPNPTSDEITIQIPTFVKSAKVELFDFSGQLIQSIESSNKRVTIDLSERSNGFYFVRVNGDSYTAESKIIKR
jgi:hypothetical protein